MNHDIFNQPTNYELVEYLDDEMASSVRPIHTYNFLRDMCFLQHKHTCEICGRTIAQLKLIKKKYCYLTLGLVYHHIIPLCIGGTNEYNNLMCLCTDCHKGIHKLDGYYKSNKVLPVGVE